MSISGYIRKILAHYDQPRPSKPQLPPHQHSPISYDENNQQTSALNFRPPLNADSVNRVQGIVGALLWYGCAIGKTFLVNLSANAFEMNGNTRVRK